jgi:hypothetical protein
MLAQFRVHAAETDALPISGTKGVSGSLRELPSNRRRDQTQLIHKLGELLGK